MSKARSIESIKTDVPLFIIIMYSLLTYIFSMIDIEYNKESCYLKTKKELVIAWIANGLSLIFAFNILSMLLTDEKNNVKEYEQMAKQFAGKTLQ